MHDDRPTPIEASSRSRSEPRTVSPNADARRLPSHTAIIMDGNGRWAVRRGLPRTAGHREGAKAVDAVVQAAASPESGIRWLTLYAFSSDNWQRPAREVRALMRLFAEYLGRERPRLVENGIRLETVGRRDRLSPGLLAAMDATECATAAGEALTLRLAIDYSARDAIVRAAEAARRGLELAPSDSSLAAPPLKDAPPAAPSMTDAPLDRASFARLLTPTAPDVDLLIRTGGEQRLSDFMLWEAAYAELHFTPVLWPDFRPEHLAEAVAEYRRRDRRFGGVLEDLDAAV